MLSYTWLYQSELMHCYKFRNQYIIESLLFVAHYLSICRKWISLHRSMKAPRCIKGALRKTFTVMLCRMTTATHTRVDRVIDELIFLLRVCFSWKLTLWIKRPLGNNSHPQSLHLPKPGNN